MVKENITREEVGEILTFITGKDGDKSWKLPDGELPTVLSILLDLLKEKGLVEVNDGYAYIKGDENEEDKDSITFKGSSRDLIDCMRLLDGYPETRKDINNFLDSFAKNEENKDWDVMSKSETVETILSYLDGYSGSTDFLKENFLSTLAKYIKEFEKKIPDMCGAIITLFYVSKNLKKSDEIISSLNKVIDDITVDDKELLERCDTLSDYIREIDEDEYIPYIDAILAKTTSPEYLIDNVEELSELGVTLAIATTDELDERYEEVRDRKLNYITEVEINEDVVRDDLEDFYKDLLETNPGILLNAMDMDEDRFRDIYREEPTEIEVSIGTVSVYVDTNDVINHLR